jgi:hypothetical protein
MSLKIELVWSAPGPRLDAARGALLAALREAGFPPYWDEWRADDPMRPKHLRQGHARRGRGAGPRLFVNQRLAWEDSRGWDSPDLAGAVASLAAVPFQAATREPLARRLRYTLVPAAALALLPKCPLCWAAYLSVATGLGVAPASGHRLILGVLAGALIASLAAVAARARVTADRRPLLAAGVAATAVLLGRLVLDSMPLVYLGLAVLAGAAVWSAWPRRPRQIPRAS